MNNDRNTLTFSYFVGLSYGELEGDNTMPHFSKLQIYTWEVFPDMAVFDWYIRLTDKDRWVFEKFKFQAPWRGHVQSLIGTFI